MILWERTNENKVYINIKKCLSILLIFQEAVASGSRMFGGKYGPSSAIQHYTKEDEP